MKSLTAVALFASTAACQVFAIDSPDDNLKIATDQIPSFSCSIELMDAENHEHFSSCSGSLIAGDSVLTAKHCLWITQTDRAEGRAIAYRVNCGGEEQITDRVLVYEGREKSASYDNMIITVPKKFNAPPVTVPESSQEATDLMNSGKACFASGYGYGFDLNTNSKQHRGFQIFPGPGKLDRDQFSLGGNVFLRPGDSGGGVYCRNSEGNFVLVGLLREAPMDFSKPGGANLMLDPVLAWIHKRLSSTFSSFSWN